MAKPFNVFHTHKKKHIKDHFSKYIPLLFLHFLWFRNEAKQFVGSCVETSDSESGTFVGCGRAFVDMSKIKKSTNKKRRQALENSKYVYILSEAMLSRHKCNFNAKTLYTPTGGF